MSPASDRPVPLDLSGAISDPLPTTQEQSPGLVSHRLQHSEDGSDSFSCPPGATLTAVKAVADCNALAWICGLLTKQYQPSTASLLLQTHASFRNRDRTHLLPALMGGYSAMVCTLCIDKEVACASPTSHCHAHPVCFLTCEQVLTVRLNQPCHPGTFLL